jgi:hypothetical protein
VNDSARLLGCDCDRVRHGACDCRPEPLQLAMSFDPAPLLALFDGRDACRILKINGQTLNEWKAGKPLSERQADRFAVRAGHHPSNLWTDYA